MSCWSISLVYSKILFYFVCSLVEQLLVFFSFFSESDNAYLLPWWRKFIWTILFIAMATTATCGNLIVIWIVMSQKRMRTVTNYFIGKWKSRISIGLWTKAIWSSKLQDYWMGIGQSRPRIYWKLALLRIFFFFLFSKMIKK